MTNLRSIPALLATTLAVVIVVAPPAHAANGDYTQVICKNPDTEQGADQAPDASMLPPGISYDAGPGTSRWSYYYTTCQLGSDTGGGVQLNAIPPGGGGSADVSPGVQARLTYAVTEPGISLLGGEAYRAIHVVDPDTTGLTFDQDNSDAGSWAQPDAFDRGTLATPFDQSNKVTIKTTSTGFGLTWRCAPPAGQTTCHVTYGSWIYELFGARLRLHDDTPPVVSNVTGSASNISYHVTDRGAGAYRTLLVIDGTLTDTRALNVHPARCDDVNPANSDPYEFATATPCPKTADVTAGFTVPDDARHVQVVAEDAAGNRTTVIDETRQPATPPPSNTTTNDQAPSGQTTIAQTPTTPPASEAPRGTSSAPDAARTEGASENPAAPKGAHLTATIGPRGQRTTHVSYASRPVVHVQLTDAHGTPIPNAEIVLHARDRRPGAPNQTLTTAHTDATGHATITAPPGASRDLTVTYPGTSATVKTTVRARVSIHATPARAGQTMTLTGALTQLRQAGVQLEIQALDGARWRTFDTTTTTTGGRYQYGYRWKPTASGRSFSLRVLVRSPLYPFAKGTSRVIRVHVR